MRFFQLFILVPVFLVTACTESTEKEQGFELAIAHINDTHSAFDPVPGYLNVHNRSVFTEFGGHPRLLTEANLRREYADEQGLPFLFLHGGDAWQGSAYFKVNEGRMNADILSRMNIDAMALGNHEFDLTNTLLNEFIDQINFPLLAANIDTSQDADLAHQTNLRAFTIFGFNGTEKQQFSDPADVPAHMTRVAVFGLALDNMADIAPNTGDIQFFDMVESAQDLVNWLHDAGVQHIIAVTHIGHANDVRVASQVDGIDVIVGGHSHTLLGDYSNIGWGDNGDYAQWVQNPGGGATCVVQAGEYAQAVGFVSVRFATDGSINSCDGHNTLLSDDTFYQTAQRSDNVALNTQEHLEIHAFVEQHPHIALTDEHQLLREHINKIYKPEVEEAYGKVIATVPETLQHTRRPGDSGSDSHGSEVAPLVALAQYWFGASDVVHELTGKRADFALVGAGGIRQNIEEGELREGDISLELLPFASGMSLLSLTGAQVKTLLEETINATLPAGAHAGKFPYGGMLRYTFEETIAGDSGEISSLELNVGTWTTPQWQPIDADGRYTVAVNGYNATGNDGWETMYRIQSEQSDRVDLAYVDGTLKAFPVSRVERDEQQRLSVVYAHESLDCNLPDIDCSSDAQAVIDFIRVELPILVALPYPVVTLERLSE